MWMARIIFGLRSIINHYNVFQIVGNAQAISLGTVNPTESVLQTQYNETKVVKALIKGDKAAFQEVYSRYSGLFFTITRRYAKTHQEAEDLLQESFVQIFRKVHTFKFNGSFEGWMKRVVVNKCLSSLKKKNMMTDMPDFEVDTGFGGSEAAIGLSRLSVEEILMAFEELPAGARTVLNLYAIDGLDHHEIASELGITESASRSQLTKARARLKIILEEQGLLN
jgi:RNA polymerase sigma-70 factor (ECF subfamily)